MKPFLSIYGQAYFGLTLITTVLVLVGWLVTESPTRDGAMIEISRLDDLPKIPVRDVSDVQLPPEPSSVGPDEQRHTAPEDAVVAESTDGFPAVPEGYVILLLMGRTESEINRLYEKRDELRRSSIHARVRKYVCAKDNECDVLRASLVVGPFAKLDEANEQANDLEARGYPSASVVRFDP